MKIRSGFVSNSSSTSYIIKGKSFDEAGEIIKKFTGVTGDYSILTTGDIDESEFNSSMYYYYDISPLEQAVIISEDYDYSISGEFATFLYDNFDEIYSVM